MTDIRNDHRFSSVDSQCIRNVFTTTEVWRQNEKFSKNSEREFEKRSLEESHKRSLLF